ncbi:O-antigen polymerase [cyanobacterium endosymbiont of Rhopalodia gibberula]|uniref:O-antigen ligase family protein n=1 Tax=cyanobacterium endosymbiont of Rhopalodia gibberula TaxID=1763363 RepID=UPI000DC6EDDF|nr:O-antigen ligase family protein [cyanobacterium endosymbiont of Rhopalodia gibberula]BBA79551.1 O-antigen polymerase [cyanobacterium endosymbiont of Rhopalodia gibberula]
MKSLLSSPRSRSNDLQWVENFLKFGVFLFPFSATIGGVGLVIALFSLWQQRFHQIISERFTWSLGVFSLWLVITTFFAFQPILALQGLPNFLPGILLLAAFPIFFANLYRLYQFAWWVVLTSILLSGLGFMQLGWGWESPLLFRSIGINLLAYGNPDGRMSSFLMYANTLAIYLLISFLLAIGLWIDIYRHRQEKHKGEMIGKLTILSLAVVGDGLGLIFTNSRSVWGLALLGVMAFAVYLRRYWVIYLTVIAVGMVVWAAWAPWGQGTMRELIPAYFWTRLTDELYDDRYVTALRTTQWRVAREMILEQPLLGWGLRNFTPVYQTEMNVWMGHPHNLFLMLFAEIGIPGTLLFCGIVGNVIFQGVRNLVQWSNKQEKRREHLLLFTYLISFCSCILFNLFDVTLFDVRVNLLGWFLLSAIAGMIEVKR